MNYYNEIKQELISNEVNKIIKTIAKTNMNQKNITMLENYY